MTTIVGGNGGERTLSFGLSTDTKPTATANSVFIEADTGKIQKADGASWAEQTNATYAAASHTHSGADITSGTINVARLGSGATASNFLRGDNTWASPPGGTEAFPIGSVFIAVVSTNPGTLLGYGTWSAFAAGRMLVGIDSGDTDFDTVEETGGAKTKTIAQANLPNISTGAGTAHTHVQDAHTHTQNSHTHGFTDLRGPTTGSATTNRGVTESADTSSTATGLLTGAATATNQNATATNQNESSHTHSLGGSGTALNVVNPYIVVYMWKRTA